MSDRVRNILAVALTSTFLTLAALSPIAYMLSQRIPPHLATVDLQKLIEEEQEQAIRMLGAGSLTDDQRAGMGKMSGEFASKLSLAVEAVDQSCNCILINKAALLSGGAADYTDVVRQRMK